MGWQGQHNRDEDFEREWRKLPLRERYNWPAVGLIVVLAIAAAYTKWWL